MSEVKSQAEADFARLMGIYRQIGAESERLSIFNMWPMFRVTLEYLIAYFGIFIEILLLPYTLIALLLRRFNVKAPILAPFTKRARYAATWLWRGELTPGVVIIRSLVRWQVKAHVERRLASLARATYLNTEIDDDARERLIERIDRERRWWDVPNLAQLSVRGTAPTVLIGGGTFAYNMIADKEAKDALLGVGIVLGLFAVIAACGVFLGSLPIKRGLFLGRTAKLACYPGGVDGVGRYGEERELLQRLGVRMPEFPIDYFSATGSTGLFLLAIVSAQGLLALQADIPPWATQAAGVFAQVYSQEELQAQWIIFAVASVFWALVIVRRVFAKRL
jgi:hypothetical protein